MVDSFRAQARRREQPLTSVPYASDSGPRPVRVRNVGLLEKIRIVGKINGQYAAAGPTGTDGALNYCGPYDRFTLRVGSLGTIFDCGGFMTAMITAIDRFARRGVTSLAHAPYSFTAAPATAAFTNKFPLTIPVGIPLRSFDAPVGLIQTAVQGQDVVLEIRHTPIGANSGDPGSALYRGNVANLTVNANSTTDVAFDYFDPIPADRFPKAQPNLSVLHTWNEFSVPITGDGTLDIELNPSNIYSRILLLIVSGTAGSLAITNDILTQLRLTYGGQQSPYDWTSNVLKQRMADDYGNVTWPGGFYVLDLLADTGDERDCFNAAAATNPRLQITTSGGTYGAGSKVIVAVEQLVPLVDGRGSYGPQGPQ